MILCIWLSASCFPPQASSVSVAMRLLIHRIFSSNYRMWLHLYPSFNKPQKPSHRPLPGGEQKQFVLLWILTSSWQFSYRYYYETHQKISTLSWSGLAGGGQIKINNRTKNFNKFDNNIFQCYPELTLNYINVKPYE